MIVRCLFHSTVNVWNGGIFECAVLVFAANFLVRTNIDIVVLLGFQLALTDLLDLCLGSLCRNGLGCLIA